MSGDASNTTTSAGGSGGDAPSVNALNEINKALAVPDSGKHQPPIAADRSSAALRGLFRCRSGSESHVI